MLGFRPLKPKISNETATFLTRKNAANKAIYVHASVIWTMQALKRRCLMMCSFRKLKHLEVSACMAFSSDYNCFHASFILPKSWGFIIAQSFLRVLVIDLSMFLVVKTEVWKIWKHQRVRHSLTITNLFSYHLYLLYIKSYERWCYSDIGMSQEYSIVLHTNASCVA